MVAWKRNLWTITAAETVALLGFMVVIPFLPFYVQELGVTDPDEIKLWSSWLFAGPALAMAVVSPLWGSLADRFGRKIMVERAMFAGVVIFLGMGFAQTVQQLMALRVLQGLLTGSVSAATALVASTTPPEHAGSSMGILQTGIYLGASVGPLVGGLIADSLGYRPTFWVTALLALMAGLAVHFAVREDFQRPKDVGGRTDRHWWDGLLLVLASPELRLILLINMLVRVAARSLSPMLPLFIAEIAPDSEHLAATAGLVAGVGAVASAAGASLLGRASDRTGPRKMLVWCIFGMALAVAGQAFVVLVGQLASLQVVAGFLAAGVLASVSALLARSVRGGRHGAVFGVNSTTIAAASAVGPLVAATVAVSWGLRSVFLTSALILGMAGLLVIWAFFMPGLKGHRSPPTSEAGSSRPVVPRDAGIDRQGIEGGYEEDG